MSSNEPLILGGDEPHEYVILGVPRDGNHGERLSFTGRQYHHIAETAQGWREADTTTDDFGSTVFRAAGILADGTLVGHTVSRGPSRREASLRVAPDGRWSSVIESGSVTTEAHGRLRDRGAPIKLQRKRSRGSELWWIVDAVTEFDVLTEDGTRIPKRTTGKVKYPGGGTGKFRTDFLAASSDGRFRDSSGTWVPGLGPGQTGTQTTKKLPGGPGNTEWERHIVDLKTGEVHHDHRIDRQGKEDDGNFHVRSSHQHTVTAGGQKSVDSTSEHMWNDDRGTHWQKETTSAGGTTTERGEFVVNGRSASVSTSTVNGDGSTTIVTTTWDTGTNKGTEHTTTTDKSGEVVSDKTVEGTADPTRGQHRPGDSGQWFDPSPESTGGEKKDDEDKDKGGQDTGGEDAGGEDNPEPGGDETETSDDGSGNDDTGGYPGLGWDGGGNGPLELLPAAARAALGRFDDPNHPLDTTGNDSGLVELLADAFAAAARRGGSSDSGLGDDTGGDPLHGVTAEDLAKAARDAPPVDPEWSDWSNPKAHAVFIDHVGINVAVEINKAPDLDAVTAVGIATALQKFT